MMRNHETKRRRLISFLGASLSSSSTSTGAAGTALVVAIVTMMMSLAPPFSVIPAQAETQRNDLPIGIPEPDGDGPTRIFVDDFLRCMDILTIDPINTAEEDVNDFWDCIEDAVG